METEIILLIRADRCDVGSTVRAFDCTPHQTQDKRDLWSSGIPRGKNTFYAKRNEVILITEDTIYRIVTSTFGHEGVIVKFTMNLIYL